MRYLFARENAPILDQLAWTRALLGFDFDGTLAPIVADRHAAEMRPETAKLLQRASELFPCVVVSGRAHADLSRRLGRVRFERVVSNLGFEPGRHDPALARSMQAARAQVDVSLQGLQGVELEDKGYSFAIHYRRSRRKRDARHAIAQAVAQLPDTFQTIPGKLVVNVVHVRAPSKATAILRLRDELRVDTVLYVGDSTSDEAVFELDQPGRLVSVRVGRSIGSRAPYYVRSQSEIDRLLSALIASRARAGAAASRG